MTASAAEYAWVAPWIDSVSQAYCLTLARGLTPQQFLNRLGAHVQASPRTGTELTEPSFDVWEEYQGGALFIGATTLPDNTDWVLGLEVNGYLGVTPAAMLPVSAGTTVVSHYRNIEMVDRFCWFDDGNLRVSFAPGAPAWREGSTPDALVKAMTEVGLAVSPDAIDNPGPNLRAEAAFALAKHLTGIRLTQNVLDHSVYLCGIAPVPEES
jgi:hypothetical protein